MDTSHAEDKRIVDDDGRLHVPDCTLSLAQVSPYLGREIPGWDSLGLIPDKVYRLYRTPELIKAMAESAPGSIPLTDDHIIVTADSPQQSRVAGAVTNLRTEGNRLIGDLSVWVGDSIARVKNEAQRELSCAYRYLVRMIPATRDGVLVDGEMLPTEGNALNHVALVAKGRAGPQATVADTGARVMKRPKIFEALSAIFGTLAKPEQLAALDMAMDEELPQAKDEFPPKKKSDEDDDEGKAKAASDAAIAEAVTKATEGMVTREEAQKMASDAAQGVIATFKAREAVASKVGVVNLDTAEAVYRFALEKSGIDHKAIAADALPALWEAMQKATPAISLDAKPATNARDLLSLSHIRKG